MLHHYLAIVGEFWQDKRYYIDLIKESDLQEQVRIEDRYVANEEADLWFRAADVLIAPYTHGVTQSAVASVALGYGMPMIVSAQVASGMEKPDQKTVIVVAPDDIQELEIKIYDFIKSYTPSENSPNISSDYAEQITMPLFELINISE